MTITSTPRWSLSRGNAVVPSRWQATVNATYPSDSATPLVTSTALPA